MRIKIHYILIGILAIISVVVSCKKGPGSTPDELDVTNPSQNFPVTGTVIGLIVNENGQPFAGVTVKDGSGHTTITDQKGYFRFTSVTLDKISSTITAEANGYFKGYRVFSASGKGTNFIKIRLLKKISVGIVNAVSGGSVTTNNYTVSFLANSVITRSTGTPYNGNITVYAQPIDPTNPNIPEVLPGSFLGIDSTNRRVVLQSFGMIAVELRGSGGEELQIANGKTATLSFNIPASLSGQAPAIIPLWYVDETSGIWKQQGQAIKNGTKYVGDVNHFSFWNCDIPRDRSLFIEMTIKNLSGSPIPYALVGITASGYTTYGYTDSTGYVGGLVPANYRLELRIFNDCNAVAHIETIGPFNANTNVDLAEKKVSLGASEVQISGTVKNCNNEYITNGWVDIYLDTKEYKAPVNSSGQFSVSIMKCNNNSITLFANDATARKTSNAYNYTIGVDPLLNLGLTACDNALLQYVVSTYAGNTDGYLDGPLATAQFKNLVGLAFDGSSNIYLTDDHRIRKISVSGIVSTVSGTATFGYADGNVSVARFNNPYGLAVDNAGNVIVADFSNNCLRKITPLGVVSTLGVRDTFGGHVNGNLSVAKFRGPKDVAIDGSGNIFVADQGNHCIRKITPTGEVSTIAGIGGSPGYADGPGVTAKFSVPNSLAVDAAGNIYVTDEFNQRIRKISIAGIVSTIAGNGLQGNANGAALSAMFYNPGGIEADANGNIFVSEQNNRMIRKIFSGVVTTIAGNGTIGNLDGPGSSATFGRLLHLIADANGNIFVTDPFNNRIRKLDPQ